MRELELLAPARNADIGIAAIDCGADAVYIAAENFGARQAAGNNVQDIARLCSYAHKFGARVFVTVNTIIYDSEIEALKKTLSELKEAKVDALIIQDPAVASLANEICPDVALHASTQCSIRDAARAKWLESLGFSRVILERQMSLEQIQDISSQVEAEVEFFVHGALCVCYSGECYLSEMLASRSANRGGCVQACRARYDLKDENGKTIVRDKALLSLKDYELIGHLGKLAQAGVVSFKIEGRLKNESYVRNVVREYSLALDALVESNKTLYRRASWGKVSSSFTPSLEKTFNRGYTSLFIDGVKGKWAAMDAAKGMGEQIGQITAIKKIADGRSLELTLNLKKGVTLANGDGFSLVGRRSEIIGFRGDVCQGNKIVCKAADGILSGAVVFRNLDSAFEKEISRSPGKREIPVKVSLECRDALVHAHAQSQDGRIVEKDFAFDAPQANDRSRIESLAAAQMSKSASIYKFSLSEISGENLPLLSASFINSIRRSLAEELDSSPCHALPLRHVKAAGSALPYKTEISYKANVANELTRAIYIKSGALSVEKAYELEHQKDAELMRSKYCIRFETGLCPKHHHSGSNAPMTLLNNSRELSVEFDCRACEMVIRNPQGRK